ncbi:hypothetical protein [Mumia zhuanghuii]|uniref:Uncharacterized protein n=1 Tax=Mumia zhuanghuii TaxID=2585211 RepID=A0A5C4M5N6_9ACTN|nr:hypothetical protein [Mumia zhuanghuii]TNC26842.1 hypothetical protein FHE65_34445 [Mumia zhuanghuii]
MAYYLPKPQVWKAHLLRRPLWSDHFKVTFGAEPQVSEWTLLRVDRRPHLGLKVAALDMLR